MAGMAREALKELYKEADCALNICGSHDLNEELESIRHLIYVESDPGVEQIKIDQGERETIDYLTAHSISSPSVRILARPPSLFRLTASTGCQRVSRW